jgi:hypothetical protein
MNLYQARQDKDDIKKTFDNYMKQVQILINQKAVEVQEQISLSGDFGNFATIISQNKINQGHKPKFFEVFKSIKKIKHYFG